VPPRRNRGQIVCYAAISRVIGRHAHRAARLRPICPQCGGVTWCVSFVRVCTCIGQGTYTNPMLLIFTIVGRFQRLTTRRHTSARLRAECPLRSLFSRHRRDNAHRAARSLVRRRRAIERTARLQCGYFAAWSPLNSCAPAASARAPHSTDRPALSEAAPRADSNAGRVAVQQLVCRCSPTMRGSGGCEAIPIIINFILLTFTDRNAITHARETFVTIAYYIYVFDMLRLFGREGRNFSLAVDSQPSRSNGRRKKPHRISWAKAMSSIELQLARPTV
jgi:hypothetical protein